MTTKRTKKGFTLIELLVVISIIALLLSIIMPSLKRAKEAGMRITCLSNLKGLARIVHLYSNDHNGDLPEGNTQGPKCWVNHINPDGGFFSYWNQNEDPELEEEQRAAIRNGVLWPWADDAIGAYRCPTSNLGYARSYSMPDSLGPSPGMAKAMGAPASLLVNNITDVKNTGGRMLFIDEGWASPDTWTIYYDQQRWLDIVPARHGLGTNLAFLDGHAEYWKWGDERTRDFAIKAMDLENPDAATGLRDVQLGNEDIRRLVTAVWGKVGW
ncbi:MAG: type II secretion system protein [Planctomycetota bacterium]|jgi:prepilin-type N-terminal cleavage/methylation domain-containing protein/prepilin-type processing-associated H-X9-DG protein